MATSTKARKTSTATQSKSAAVERPAPKKEPLKPKAYDPNQIVTVKNGFQGRLIYKSKKTGEVYVWENFGDEQDMDIAELRNAKNSAKDFFIQNWFMFDDEELIDYLGVRQYYKYALKIEDFDSIFTKSPDEIKDIVENLSRGQKKSLIYRAKQLIADGQIDSNRVIKALEDCLGVQLVER